MIEEEFERAVRSYWEVRTRQRDRQRREGKRDTGMRGAVTGGAHMDALAELVASIFVKAGFTASSIHRTSRIELPGFFRAEKKWDLVVVHDDHLAAAIEFKSQVGSPGKNNNNRIEEAIGSAIDLRLAHRKRRLGKTKPWLGYFFLLEEPRDPDKPVRVKEPLFSVDPQFAEASYKDRYEILCRRLVEERLYDAACFVTSTENPKDPIYEPAADLSFENFIAGIHARAKQLVATE